MLSRFLLTLYPILYVFRVSALCFTAATAVHAKDMTFSLQVKDFRPNFDLYEYIFADGDIVPGTKDRFLAFLANYKLTRNATVIFNSSGGSLMEGMELGDAIRARHFRTNVGTRAAQPPAIEPGKCINACIFSYLGGDYRYLTDGSAIGIHQFRFDTGFNPAETAIVGQQLLGKVFDFVKRSRVDTSLFALMISISADRVYVFSREELHKFRIVTGDVFSEKWAFEMKDDVSYLKGTQLTSRGRNKVIFTCPPGKKGKSPYMTFLSQLPSREEVIRRTKRVILFIDDVAFPVPRARVAGPHLQGGDYIGWSIEISPKVAEALKVADRIGGGLSPVENLSIFAGFSGIGVVDSRQKIASYLDNCH